MMVTMNDTTAIPDALAVSAGELAVCAAGQLEGGCVGRPVLATLVMVSSQPPLVRPQGIGVLGGFGLPSRVLGKFRQNPGVLIPVVFDDSGFEANQLHGARLLLVPGHVVLINAGERTQPPQLEVHLARVLAGAGDGDVPAAHEVPPAPPPRVHEATVLTGAAIQQINSVVQINLFSSVIISPFSFFFFIAEKVSRRRTSWRYFGGEISVEFDLCSLKEK